MDKNANTTSKWKDEKVSVRVKLSVLWIGVMFILPNTACSRLAFGFASASG